VTFAHGPVEAPPPVVPLLPQLLDFAARQYGESPFLLTHSEAGWQARSFARCAREMHAFAALLAREGVRSGDRVGIQSENRAEWGLAYLAVLDAGGVVVPLDAQLKPQEVGEILATSGATHCIVSERLLENIDSVRRERLPSLHLIGLDSGMGLPSWEDAQRDHAGAPRRESTAQPGDLAVVIFTSGTTGQAKGVMLSHRNLLSNVEAAARTLQFGPADRLLSVLPLHHTFESTCGFLCPMRMGASIAYARGLNSKELREDLQSSGSTMFIAVPLLYEKLLTAIQRGIDERRFPQRLLVRSLLLTVRTVRLLTRARAGRRLMRPLREKAGLGSLRLFVCGAAPLAPEVFWGLMDLGLPVLEGYGLTETSPIACANRPSRPEPGGVGWPVPGVEVRIVDPDSEGNGEIAIRGPNVMLGYYANPAATAEVLRDGWFYTGDLGRLLPDGRLTITGRLKNMIATAAGKKIYPEEIEVHLANCPYVLEVVVAGGRDARGEREEVHAYLVPNLPEIEAHAALHGKKADDAYVEALLKHEVETRCASLAPYKRVKRVIVRKQEFPKTTTGKIRRQVFAAEAEAEARRVGAVA
jgi:long-chain acyl-CoA synthetase